MNFFKKLLNFDFVNTDAEHIHLNYCLNYSLFKIILKNTQRMGKNKDYCKEHKVNINICYGNRKKNIETN